MSVGSIVLLMVYVFGSVVVDVAYLRPFCHTMGELQMGRGSGSGPDAATQSPPKYV